MNAGEDKLARFPNSDFRQGIQYPNRERTLQNSASETYLLAARKPALPACRSSTRVLRLPPNAEWTQIASEDAERCASKTRVREHSLPGVNRCCLVLGTPEDRKALF